MLLRLRREPVGGRSRRSGGVRIRSSDSRFHARHQDRFVDASFDFGIAAGGSAGQLRGELVEVACRREGGSVRSIRDVEIQIGMVEELGGIMQRMSVVVVDQPLHGKDPRFECATFGEVFGADVHRCNRGIVRQLVDVVQRADDWDVDQDRVRAGVSRIVVGEVETFESSLDTTGKRWEGVQRLRHGDKRAVFHEAGRDNTDAVLGDIVMRRVVRGRADKGVTHREGSDFRVDGGDVVRAQGRQERHVPVDVGSALETRVGRGKNTATLRSRQGAVEPRVVARGRRGGVVGSRDGREGIDSFLGSGTYDVEVGKGHGMISSDVVVEGNYNCSIVRKVRPSYRDQKLKGPFPFRGLRK